MRWTNNESDDTYALNVAVKDILKINVENLLMTRMMRSLIQLYAETDHGCNEFNPGKEFILCNNIFRLIHRN